MAWFPAEGVIGGDPYEIPTNKFPGSERFFETQSSVNDNLKVQLDDSKGIKIDCKWLSYCHPWWEHASYSPKV